MSPFVLAEDDLPNPFIRQLNLPPRHGRLPWHTFNRQAHSALLDAPEKVAFLEHRDRRRVGEVGRRGVEAAGSRTLAVEISAVAGRAERGVETLALHDVLRRFRDGVRQTGVLARRRGMNGA